MRTTRSTRTDRTHRRWRVALALAGCLVSMPSLAAGDPETTADPAQTTAIVRWPMADGSPLAALFRDTPDRLPGAVAIDEETIPREMPYREAVEFLRPTHEIVANELSQTGLLRVYRDLIDGDDLPADHQLTGYGLGFKANASFIPALWWQLQGEGARSRARRLHEPQAKVSAHPPWLTITADEHDLLLGQGVAMHIPTTITGDERGIVVHLWSLAPNEYEQGVLDEFAREGWLVVDVDADVRNRPPNWPMIEAARDRQTMRTNELFKRAQARSEIAIPESDFAVHPGDDLNAKGALIARAIDSTLAQHAYAVEAIVSYLDQAHPPLAGKPIVVAGFSAGAIVTPTVAARLRGRFEDRPVAMVMVGGAGDLFSTAMGSSLTKAGLDLTPDTGVEPSAQTIAQIAAAYRANTQLDPLTLAPLLQDIPAYFLLGSRDTMVPYDQGRLLASGFPRARVDTLPVGHEALFLTLHFKQRSIVRWTQRALEAE